MGGLGSGLAYDETDVRRIAGAGLGASPVTTEVLVEESVRGWKEYELELMRDKHDNVVVVCSIENLDPMGVHTGDSITVAPAMTLTDREYQHMRDVGIAVLREVGVDTGGCNIQFAIDPATGRMIVIEMNPRSRAPARWRRRRPASRSPRSPPSSRSATRSTRSPTTSPAEDGRTRFEPTLDYVVVKVPRFAFEKFPGADPADDAHEERRRGDVDRPQLHRGARQGAAVDGDEGPAFWTGRLPTTTCALAATLRGTHRRPALHVEQALRAGATVEQVAEATGIDPWFVDQIALIAEVGAEVADAPTLTGPCCARRSGTACPTSRSPRCAA